MLQLVYCFRFLWNLFFDLPDSFVRSFHEIRHIRLSLNHIKGLVFVTILDVLQKDPEL